MKTTVLITAIALFFAACSAGKVSYKEARERNEDSYRKMLTPRESEVMVDLSSKATLASKLTEMAKERGYSQQIIDLADEVENDANSIEEEIKDFAEDHYLVLPDEMSYSDQETLSDVSSRQTVHFDRAFVSALKDALDEQMELMNDLRSINNEDVQDLVEDNMKEIENIKEEVDEKANSLY